MKQEFDHVGLLRGQVLMYGRMEHAFGEKEEQIPATIDISAIMSFQRCFVAFCAIMNSEYSQYMRRR